MSGFGFRDADEDDLSDLVRPSTHHALPTSLMTSDTGGSGFGGMSLPSGDTADDLASNPFAGMESSTVIGYNTGLPPMSPFMNDSTMTGEHVYTTTPYEAVTNGNSNQRNGFTEGASENPTGNVFTAGSRRSFSRESAPEPETPVTRSRVGSNDFLQHQHSQVSTSSSEPTQKYGTSSTSNLSQPLSPSLDERPFGFSPPVSPTLTRSIPSSSSSFARQPIHKADLAALLGEEKPILPTFSRRRETTQENPSSGAGSHAPVLPVSSLGKKKPIEGPLAALLGMEEEAIEKKRDFKSATKVISKESTAAPIPSVAKVNNSATEVLSKANLTSPAIVTSSESESPTVHSWPSATNATNSAIHSIVSAASLTPLPPSRNTSPPRPMSSSASSAAVSRKASTRSARTRSRSRSTSPSSGRVTPTDGEVTDGENGRREVKTNYEHMVSPMDPGDGTRAPWPENGKSSKNTETVDSSAERTDSAVFDGNNKGEDLGEKLEGLMIQQGATENQRDDSSVQTLAHVSSEPNEIDVNASQDLTPAASALTERAPGPPSAPSSPFQREDLVHHAFGVPVNGGSGEDSQFLFTNETSAAAYNTTHHGFYEENIQGNENFTREVSDEMKNVPLDDDLGSITSHNERSSSPPLPPVPSSPAQSPAPIQGSPRSTDIGGSLGPSFIIHVGDPQKVGNPLNPAAQHTVYTVRTRTTSSAYRKPDFSVLRRFSHFLWLFDALTINNPGVIVPGMPEKNAIGRFGSEFVENRRSALQAALMKIISHPMLVGDPDLRLFLESDTFSVDIKQRKMDAPSENKGFLASIGASISGPKFEEFDEYFDTRRQLLDSFEAQLKGLLTALANAAKMRVVLQTSLGELQSALLGLSQCDLSASLRNALEQGASVQKRVRELSEQQSAVEDQIGGLNNVAEGYARLCASARLVFGARIKAYHNWQASEQNLRKARSAHEKAKRSGRAHSELLGLSLAEISDAERNMLDAKEDFEDVSKLTKAEMARFDKEKVEDFKKAIEDYADGLVIRQREVVVIWQAYQDLLVRMMGANNSASAAPSEVPNAMSE